MALNLHYLRLFAVVADAQSISRGARVAHISQPAVSKALTLLELQVGAPLLERGRRGVLLTEAGRALHAHARAIFEEERAAEEELARLRGVEHGTVRIGASTTIATYLLPELLATFHRLHPRVAMRVASANTQETTQRLIARELDVALVEGPVHDRRVQALPWREEELVVIAAPGHPLTTTRRIDARDLADELFILREAGSGTRDVVETALRRHRVLLSQTLEVGSTEAIKQAVAAGLGISVVSRTAAEDQISLGRLRIVPVRDLAIRRRLTRLTLPGRRVPPAADAFIALLA